MKISLSTLIDKYLGTLLILCGVSIFIWGGFPFLLNVGRYLTDFSDSSIGLLKEFIFPFGPFIAAWMLTWCLPGLYFISRKAKQHLKTNKRIYIGLWILAFLILTRFLVMILEHKA